MKSKSEFLIKLVFAALIGFTCLSHLVSIYNVTVNRSYLFVSYDEPFAINGGINALNKGDPLFYMYGGTSIYPFTIAFLLNQWTTGVKPHYQALDQIMTDDTLPGSSKIFPVRPIYLTKAVMTAIVVIGTFFFVLLSSLILLPLPFLFVRTIDNSAIFSYYQSQVLPETHIALLSGFCCIFFIGAVLSQDKKAYFKMTCLSAVAASLCVAAKISSFYIFLLPLSLAFDYFLKNGFFDFSKWRKLFLCFITPYILINPAVVLNGRNYLNYLKWMAGQSKHVSDLWFKRVPEIHGFLRDLYIYNAWPNSLLIVLFALTCILFVRKNPIAFFGFIFFFFFSFQNLAGMSFFLYPRHFIFLLIPATVFFLFPFYYFFQKLGSGSKRFATLFCLIFSFYTLPFKESLSNWQRLKNESFATHWDHDTRDDFREFVRTTHSVIYFYDVHKFSLPNDLGESLIPFNSLDQLPKNLKANEFIGFVHYKNCDLERYNVAVTGLLKNYRVQKSFMSQDGLSDYSFGGPGVNPAIILLRN